MLVQTLLIAIVTFIGYMERFLGSPYLWRPICMGTAVGLILGDLQTGVTIGATLELAYMGTMAIGGALPPELPAGTILGTAFAITTGSGVEVALALSLPIATIALLFKNALFILFRSACTHKADKYAEQADSKGVARMHFVSTFSLPVMMTILVALSFWAGSSVIESVLNAIPQFIIDGLNFAAKLLPALGFAMLTRMIISKQVVPFMFLGFVLSAYLGLPVLAIAIIGAVVAVAIVISSNLNTTSAVKEVSSDDDF